MIHAAQFRVTKDYRQEKEVTAEHIENLDHGIAIKMEAHVSMVPEALLRKNKKNTGGRFTGEGILYTVFRGELKQEVFHYGKLIGTYVDHWGYYQALWTNDTILFGEPRTFGEVSVSVCVRGLGIQYPGFEMSDDELEKYLKVREDFDNYETATSSSSSTGHQMLDKLFQSNQAKAVLTWLPAEMAVKIGE